MRTVLAFLLLCATAFAEPGHSGSVSISTTTIGPSGSLYINAQGATDKISISTVNAKTISATNIYGNGSGLTGVLPASVSWVSLTGVPTVLQNISNSAGSVTATAFAGNVSGTNGYFRNVSATNLTVPGNTLLDGSGLTQTSGGGCTGTLYSNGTQSSCGYGIITNGTLDLRIGGGTRAYMTGSANVFFDPTTFGANTSPNAALDVYGIISGTALRVGSVSATNVSLTGNLSATKFYGDGSGLTGIAGGSPSWYSVTSVPTVLQNISNSTGSVSVTTLYASSLSTTALGTVSGTYGYFKYVSGTFAGNGSGLTGVVASASPGGPSGSVQFNLGGSTTSGTAAFSIANNNVGIGTNAPPYRLTVQGNSALTSFTGATPLGVLVRGAASSNDYSGIDFNAYSGATSSAVARIGAIATNLGSYLSFGTSNAYGSGITNQAMTIDYAGNVGIGTIAPNTKLEVAGTISASVINTPSLTIAGVGYKSSPFSGCYQTPDETVTLGGRVAETHGLGGIPKIVQGFMKNVTAQCGFTTGDVVEVGGYNGTNAASFGVSHNVNSTSITIIYGNGGIVVPTRSSGGQCSITAANWNYYAVVCY